MSRTLSRINAAGLVLLGGLCIHQWDEARHASEAYLRLQAELATARKSVQEALHRNSTLAEDLDSLKTALAHHRQAADAATLRAAHLQDRLDQSDAELSAARQALSAWETALSDRDRLLSDQAAHIADLEQQLGQAISRANEAILRIPASPAPQ